MNNSRATVREQTNSLQQPYKTFFSVLNIARKATYNNWSNQYRALSNKNKWFKIKIRNVIKDEREKN